MNLQDHRSSVLQGFLTPQESPECPICTQDRPQLTPLPTTARLHSPGTPAALHLWQRPFSFSLGCLFPNSWTLNSCVITTGVCSVFLLPWFIDRHTHNSPCRKVIFWWSTPRKQEAPQISLPGNEQLPPHNAVLLLGQVVIGSPAGSFFLQA